MSRSTARLGTRNRPLIVTNSDEDCSSEASRAFLDELFAGPDPALESLDAAEALRELRVDAGA